MPKKLHQQAEQNGQALSREDRKNEQIMRMIERAEKQRIKREEKKKAQVLNKGKVGVSRKQKKLGLLQPKNTQVAINILFSEKARAQNASNRYFFERKQMIEEKQRLEQEELWTKYAMRVQQMQQQQQAQAPQYLPAPQHHSMVAAASQSFNQATGFPGAPLTQAQPQAHVSPQLYASSVFGAPNGADLAAQTSMGLQFQTPQMGQMVAAHASGLAEPQHPQQASYLNAGETGGNYEGGNDDHSGSSYLSSASKRQQPQALPADQAAGAQQRSELATQAQTSQSLSRQQPGQSAALPRLPSAVAPALHPLLMPAPSQQSASLGQVLNDLPSKSSGDERPPEEAKDSNKQIARAPIRINVQLGKAHEVAPTAAAAAQSTETAARASDSAMILELTRKKMQQTRN